MNAPALSVVVAVRDGEQTLGATLDSVRRQAFRDWECIVVDDASGDGTASVIKDYLSRDARFERITHRASVGVDEARASGLRAARAGRVCFVDAGHQLETGALASSTPIDDARAAAAAVDLSADVLLIAHKDYHVRSFALLLDALRGAGATFAFVNLAAVSGDEGARAAIDRLGLPVISYNQLMLGGLAPTLVVCMNDWDPAVRRVVEACKRAGIRTVGVVEGIQDYQDVNRRNRAPYRTVNDVILPGEFDTRYFVGAGGVHVGGVPRIDALLGETPRFPADPLVVINSNFTYGVLVDQRDAWVRQAVEGCRRAGYDYVISRHPADRGDFTGYQVAGDSMYDAVRRGSVVVSRFGSAILEALAMGKPVVYFNPHGERVDKFKQPNGAFAIAASVDELAGALGDAVDDPQRFLAHADDYLELHCGTRRGGLPASQRVGSALVNLYRAAPAPGPAQRARLASLLVAQAPPSRDDPGSLQAALRKLRKLARDPRGFFEDSRIRPVHLLKHLFSPGSGL